MHGAVAGLIAMGLGLWLPAAAEAQMMRLGETLVLTVPELAAGTEPAAFEAHVRDRVLPALKTASPARPAHLFRADRGSRKGQYALVSANARAHGAAELGPLAQGPGHTLEYQLVGPSAALGPLPDVDVLGLHFIKVRPDRRDAFERFVRDTVHPAVGNLRPDLRILYYRSSKTPDAGAADYLALFALTTRSRDKYWPGGSDSDDLRAAFGPVRGITMELATYLVEGSYLADPKFAAAIFESREWTDFVLVF
jgi:hypothetical protein